MMPSDDPDANHHLHHLCAEDRIPEQVDYSSRFSQDLVDADDIVIPSSPYDDDFLPPLPHNLLPDFAAGLWDVAPSSSSRYVRICTYVYLFLFFNLWGKSCIQPLYSRMLGEFMDAFLPLFCLMPSTHVYSSMHVCMYICMTCPCSCM
jgi:hypothetical protein